MSNVKYSLYQNVHEHDTHKKKIEKFTNALLSHFPEAFFRHRANRAMRSQIEMPYCLIIALSSHSLYEAARTKVNCIFGIFKSEVKKNLFQGKPEGRKISSLRQP